MTTQTARWEHFTADEQAIIQYALTATADFLAEDATGGEIDRTGLEGAAREYLATVELAGEISDHRGEPRSLTGEEALEAANMILDAAA